MEDRLLHYSEIFMYTYGASQVALMVKNLPTKAGDRRRRLPGQEDPLEEGMATHPSILTWRIPWTGKPGGLQSVGSQELGTTDAT